VAVRAEAAIEALFAVLMGGAVGDPPAVGVATGEAAAAEGRTRRVVARGARGRSASAVTRAVSETGAGPATTAEPDASQAEGETAEAAVSLDEMRAAVAASIELPEGALEALAQRRVAAVAEAVVVEGEAELPRERVLVRGVEAGGPGVGFDLE
ncbi:MAG: hypothetical protein AAF078_12890, partial [Planctomycetota bacterium]